MNDLETSFSAFQIDDTELVSLEMTADGLVLRFLTRRTGWRLLRGLLRLILMWRLAEKMERDIHLTLSFSGVRELACTLSLPGTPPRHEYLGGFPDLSDVSAESAPIGNR